MKVDIKKVSNRKNAIIFENIHWNYHYGAVCRYVHTLVHAKDLHSMSLNQLL